MPSTSFHAMGSKISVVADGDSADVRAILGEVRGWFLAWEACLSRFQPESELRQLNRQAGQLVVASETLWAVVNAALEAAQQTDGLITPTILPALEAAGYDQSFVTVQASHPAPGPSPAVQGPTHPAGRGAREMGSRSDIQLDPATHGIHMPAGMRLDLGGFAKGWAADEAARRLGAIFPALVDAGGDIAVSGARADGSAWPVGIGHPQNPRQNLAVMHLLQGGLATSGRNYRRWLKDGRPQHHLIDPRSGEPAETDVFTASVIASSALEAEVAAKMALILGSREGVTWLQERCLTGILVLENGSIQRIP